MLIEMPFDDIVNDEIWNLRLTGGKHSSLAISVFLILPASSSVMPRTNSVR